MQRQIEKENKITSLIIVAVTGAMVAAVMNCFSIFIFSVLSWVILLAVDEVVFKNDKKNTTMLLIIWIIYMASIVWIYYAQIEVYGVPYILSDDYYMETEWVKECLDKNFFTISQMVRGSSFFQLANCNAFILFFAYINRFADLFGGYHTIDGRIVNATAAIISGILVAKICKKNIGKDGGNRTGKILLLAAVFPNIVYISAHIYRDCYLMLLLTFLFYIWNEEQMRKKPLCLILLSLLDFYLLYWNRAFSVVYGLAIVYLELFFNRFDKRIIDRKYSKLQLLGVAIAGFAIILFAVWILRLERFWRYMNGYSVINTEHGGLKGFVYGISLLPIGWLLRIIFYLCAPFYPQILGDFQFGSSLDIIYIILTVGTIFLFFIYPYLLKGIFRFNSVSAIFLVIFCSSAVVTSGFRHIMMSYPFMFILSAYGYSNTDYEERRKYMGYSFAVLLAYILLYIFSRII